MLVMSRIRHAAIVLNQLVAGQKSGQNIPKNRSRTTIAKRMVRVMLDMLRSEIAGEYELPATTTAMLAPGSCWLLLSLVRSGGGFFECWL